MAEYGWFRRLAAVCIARPVHRLGGSRGLVTALRLILGLAAAAALAAGEAWFASATALLLVGFLLARADAGFAIAARGEAEGERGARNAFLVEVCSNALAFAGLGLGLQAEAIAPQPGDPKVPEPMFLGLIAALAVTALPLLVKRLEVIDGRRSSEFAGIAGFDADDVVLLVPIALWLGWAQGLMMLAAFGGAAFAGGLYMAHFRKFHSLT